MNIGIDTSTDAKGRAVVTVSGAIDVLSRDRMIEAGRAALQTDAPALVLDLADVSFMDSTGIGALVELGHDAEDAESQLVIRHPSDRVLRILRMTGLEDAWTMEEQPA